MIAGVNLLLDQDVVAAGFALHNAARICVAVGGRSTQAAAGPEDLLEVARHLYFAGSPGGKTRFMSRIECVPGCCTC